MFVLVSLLVCLIPTTIGGLLSAIGIAGMDRLVQHNVLAMSGRAVEAAGDVAHAAARQDRHDHVRQPAGDRVPAAARRHRRSSWPTRRSSSSLADETPEGRSIVVLAKEKYGIRGRELARHGAVFVPFTAQTRMSGVDLDGRQIRKGAADAIERYVAGSGGADRAGAAGSIVDRIARAGGTPLVVAERTRALGVIHLKDIVKGGIRERFAALRAMGIRTVMITGDNPLTAASIAAEAGVDDFLAEATPEDKMALIKREQRDGKLVAMTGDGTNDAPGAGAGRRRRGDEHRHAGGEGSRQHGRSRLEPDQADRHRRDRQAAADDARRADDVLDRQRRGEVLRDHPGDVRRGVPGADGAEHHGAEDAAVGDPVGRHLQRADHRRAGAAGAARRAVSRR